MTRRIVVVALAVLALALAASPALAAPARPAIARAAATVQSEEGLTGSAEVTGCHPGATDSIVVCQVTMNGVVEGPEGLMEASCVTAIAAVWHAVKIEIPGLLGTKVKGSLGGAWTTQLVANVSCEGSPV